MQTVNLKKYYYPLFTKDTFVEVSDEVAEALLHMYREDNNRNRKIYYHKAYYSLDREDGIENAAFNFVEKSPEEIMLEQEEERLFLVTLNRLSEAMENLTPLQYRRVHARYFLGMKVGEIAAVEGVGVSVVSGSLRGALASIRRYFEKKKWRLYEE